MKTTSGAFKVAAGIFLSRVSGLVRDRIFAHYFGNSLSGDVFRAAMRIPNFLQNLFGEGVLSASFIPVYAHLLAAGDRKQAEQLAGFILTWLLLLVSLLVAMGLWATPLLIDLIAPGFDGEKRALAVELVQIFFPATGLLVLSAWCLGVLNSHRQFFLSYVAPVFCNIALIVALLVYGSGETQGSLAVKGAWGFVIGALLQILVQIPNTLKATGRIRLGLGLSLSSVQTTLRNFLPAVFSRGIVQISAYIDTMLASLLPTGALSALAYAQTLYLLPVSLFGMSISASQLPAMSSHQGNVAEIAPALCDQLLKGLRRIAYLVVPSLVAFCALGDVVVGAIYQGGRFGAEETFYVWLILSGYSLGLLPATLGRLYASTFYALRDTRTPLKFAFIRVLLSTALGYWGSLQGPAVLGFPPTAGAVALTLAASLSGSVEFLLLKRRLRRVIGSTSLPWSFLTRVWLAALLSAAIGALSKSFWPLHPLWQVATVLVPFGLSYLALTSFFKLAEAEVFTRKLKRFR